MSRSYLVITAVGPDRPGLVDAVSEFVYSHDGNVEGSRAATLGGEFAIVMLVSGGDADIASIVDGIDGFAAGAGLSCTVKPTTAPQEGPAPAPALGYVMTVHAMDHPGIVQAVTHHLAAAGVNIEALDTQVESAPHTGTAVFRLQAKLSLPAEVNIPRFRAELQGLGEGLNVDIQLTAMEE